MFQSVSGWTDNNALDNYKVREQEWNALKRQEVHFKNYDLLHYFHLCLQVIAFWVLYNQYFGKHDITTAMCVFVGVCKSYQVSDVALWLLSLSTGWQRNLR